MPDLSAEPQPANLAADVRLDSWKEIAVYLKRQVRTVQLWEKNEGLPVHRHDHRKRGTVYAFKPEIEAWWISRRSVLEKNEAELRPSQPWTGLVGATAAVMIAAGVVWFAALRRPAVPAAEPKVVPLTSYPGIEIGASFSPDGNQVAFARREGREDFDLYVKVLGQDQPLRLTSTPESDVGPAWSPDGRAIAFYRSARGGGNAIYTVSPLGGSERLLADLRGTGADYSWPGSSLPSAQLSWSPDGKWLAFVGIELLSVATGERRRLTSSPFQGPPDSHPAFSPDGRTVAFLRGRTSNVKDIHVVSAAGGKPGRLTTDNQVIAGLCWTADGREIVYSSSASAYAESASLWRVAVSGGPPRRLAVGADYAWGPFLSRQGRLAFTRRVVDLNIWRVDASQNSGFQKPASKWIASTRTDAAPAFSPDGKRIAFTSNRSGTMQIWLCDRDGSNASQLTSFPSPGAELAAWSPDGRYIAFNSAVRGNYDIYVIAAQGGITRQLTAESSDDAAPNWSRNGRSIYFASDRTGRLEVWKVPVAGGAAVQVTKNGGHKPVESPDGKFVYFNRTESVSDAWKVAVDGGRETPVLENLRGRWALAKNGLYLFEQEQVGERAGTWFLKFFDFATGRRRPVAALGGMPVVGQIPSVSPDGRTFLYTQLDIGEADLMLVENFR